KKRTVLAKHGLPVIEPASSQGRTRVCAQLSGADTRVGPYRLRRIIERPCLAKPRPLRDVAARRSIKAIAP
ncbi:MAG: hypothetical protein M1531_09690, partial [Chloroflexi bacterium]|nr:hypothetical protein [Chloroflexota bacterium]